jgi:hypothetical protein
MIHGKSHRYEMVSVLGEVVCCTYHLLGTVSSAGYSAFVLEGDCPVLSMSWKDACSINSKRFEPDIHSIVT